MSQFYNIASILSLLEYTPIVDEIDQLLLGAALVKYGTSENDIARILGRPCDAKWNSRLTGFVKNVRDSEAVIIAMARKYGLDVDSCRLTTRPTGLSFSSAPQQIPFFPVEPRYLSFDSVVARQTNISSTGLWKWLKTHFKAEELAVAVEAYHLGAADTSDPRGNYDILFPYVDAAGKVVDCRHQRYNMLTGSSKCNGKRMSSGWILADMGVNARRAPWPLFGEHLLSARPDDVVGVVEGEKGAIICSMIRPNMVWVATQGKSNFRPGGRCEILRGRKVICYPDRDSFDEWSALAAGMVEAGFDVTVDSSILTFAGEPKDGIDDVWLRQKFPEKF